MNKNLLNNLFKDKRIIFFGDDHNMNQGRDWLAEQIDKSIKKIDFLALEYIESSKQELLEKGKSNQLKRYLKKTFLDFPGFSPDSILNIVAVCRAKEIKISGIEIPKESFTDWTNKNAQIQRVKHLTNEVKSILPLGNGIVLMGADHVEKREDNVYGKIKSELGDKNDILSVLFIGGKKWTIDTEDYYIRKLELDAKLNKKEKTLYAYRIKKDSSVPSDWVIHFPQVEQVATKTK